MYCWIWFLLGFVLESVVVGYLSNSTISKTEERLSVKKSVNYPRTTMNSLMKMRALQRQVNKFYDDFGPDYEIDHRLNSSTLSELDSLLSLKFERLHCLKQRKAEDYIKIQYLETSCSRMKSAARSNNVVVLGLRYAPHWDDVFTQLTHLGDHLGVKFDEHCLKGITQNRLILKPSFSRLVLTFKKVVSKQVFLIKFKLALEQYEKTILEKNINYRTRKLGNVPHLLDCHVFIQDDIDKSYKILYGELKKLQRRYPRFMHCYIKDSRIYYKLVNKIRPTSLDRQGDLNVLKKTLSEMYAASKNESWRGDVERKKLFRSGTMFPWEVYQFNRTRINNMLRIFTSTSPPVGLVIPPSLLWS